MTLDLKDAYFQVPIHKGDRKFLRFMMDGEAYQYRSLPFGLSTAPHVFTRLTQPLLNLCRERGIRATFYLDDFLLLAQSRKKAEAHRDFILDQLAKLGFQLNLGKSSPTPSQSFEYLGLVWSTDPLKLALPRDKREAIKAHAGQLLSGPPTAKELMSFLGKLNYAAQAVPMGRMQYCPLQVDLRSVYKRAEDLPLRVHLSREAVDCLLWWRKLPHCSNTIRPDADRPQTVITMDASTTGFGATWGRQELEGTWQGTPPHINNLEMIAVLEALRKWGHRLRRHTILLQTDNMTVFYYLQKQGGTHSQSLNDLTLQVFQRCRELDIVLIPSFLQRIANVSADALSRGKTPMEWSLNSSVFQRIAMRWGPFQVDMFASELCHQLTPFFSIKRADRGALAMNAFHQDWNRFRNIYLFPPPALIPEVVYSPEELSMAKHSP